MIIKMATYTAEEYTDMIIAYGMAGGNNCEAARIYKEQYPKRERHPSKQTIYNCVVRARETGSVLPQRGGIDETPSIEVLRIEQVLETFAENPDSSISEIAEMLNMKRRTVLRTLQEHGFHPESDDES